MTDWTDGAAILAYVGVSAPSEDETAWATACAAAVSAGFGTRLGRDGDETGRPAEWAELTRAAVVAGAYAYKQRSAPLGVSTFADIDGAAIRLTRDALEVVAPILDRYAIPGMA